HICGFPPDSGACQQLSCKPASGQYCGVVGNGCGGKMDCGACPQGLTCGANGISGLCGQTSDAGACVKTQCQQPGGKYCGTVGDGCGGVVDCGGCSAGLTCGGAGTAGVCGAAPDAGTCPVTSCQQTNGKYCGVVGNGCGGEQDCGGCSSPASCGGDSLT